MLPDETIMCPLSGFDPKKGTFRASCRSIVSKCTCPKYVHIIGVNKNNNQPVDKFGCIDSFMHMLMIENTAVANQTTAEMHQMRNQLAKTNDDALHAWANTRSLAQELVHRSDAVHVAAVGDERRSDTKLIGGA